MNATDPGQQGIDVLEGPGDKSQKSLSVCRFPGLHFTDFYQMFETFLQCLYMAEHHGSGSSDMELMGFMHDIQPFLRSAFALTNQAADSIDQDLGPGPG